MFYTSVDVWGDNVLVRGFNGNRRFQKKVKFSPSLFVTCKNPTHKTMFGQSVGELKFDSIKEAKDYIHSNKDVSNFDIFGQENWKYAFIGEAFGNALEYDESLAVKAFIDIEVQSDRGFPFPEKAEWPVTAITYKASNDSHYYTWACGEFESTDKNVRYVNCSSEKELLSKFLNHWSNDYPDVISGWNSKFFDLTYLVNRIRQILGEDKMNLLSPWGLLRGKTTTIKGKEQQSFNIFGIAQLDYMDLFLKFAVPKMGAQESYSLDHIAHVVLGERKIDYSEYGDLNELYRKNFHKFVEYNIRDTALVVRMDEQLQFISLCLALAYKAGSTYDDALGTVGIWDAYIYNELRKKGVVIPLHKHSRRESIDGGFVKQPINGKYKWIVSFDLDSLYPHIILQYNLSPETLVPGRASFSIQQLLNREEIDFDRQYCLTARGNYFRKDVQGILPSIIEPMYAERKMVRNKMREEKDPIEYKRMDLVQHSIKILMNSLYGAMLNPYFRYFSSDMGESVTHGGQLTIQWIEKTLNEYMNKVLKTQKVDYVIAMDTDSVYLNFEPIVKQVFPDGAEKEKIVDFLDKVSTEKIQPLLKQSFQELHKYMGSYGQYMNMKREVIAESGFWTGKKHYVLKVNDNEETRLETPEIKVIGMESKKSSTPKYCRDILKESYEVILDKSESDIQKFIKAKKKEFMGLRFEEIACPRGVSDIETYQKGVGCAKGTPVQVRAAIIYNRLLNEKELAGKYKYIFSGDKIKFLYLKEPNIYGEHVIGFNATLPSEFEVEPFIDYGKQFEVTFLKPLRGVLDAVGWSEKKVNTLNSFF